MNANVMLVFQAGPIGNRGVEKLDSAGLSKRTAGDKIEKSSLRLGFEESCERLNRRYEDILRRGYWKMKTCL